MIKYAPLRFKLLALAKTVLCYEKHIYMRMRGRPITFIYVLLLL